MFVIIVSPFESVLFFMVGADGIHEDGETGTPGNVSVKGKL